MDIFFFFGGGGTELKLNYFGGHLYIFQGFFLGQCTELDYFWGLLNFKYFLGMPDAPDILGVNSRCWVQAYVSRINRVPTSPWVYAYPS